MSKSKQSASKFFTSVAVAILLGASLIGAGYHMLKNKNTEVDADREIAAQIEAFDTEYTDYMGKLEAVTGPDWDKLPAKGEITVSEKIEPEQTWRTIKARARELIDEYNSANPDKMIRYQIDPEALLSEYSLEQKVAQLFVFGVTGPELTGSTSEDVKTIAPGGVILFGKDINSEAQLKELTAGLQQTNATLPLFVAVDQEGGIVKRISWDDTGSHNLIASLSKEQQCDQWRKRSRTLHSSGINWNFGTVGDVTTDRSSFIYPRIFAPDYKASAANVNTAVACQTEVLNTVKHWPGHGGTQLDTHLQLAQISSRTEAQWLAADALPFSAAVTADADSIMVGHLIIPWLDNAKPATLSGTSLKYLREHQHFKGLIITDDLNMLTQSGYTLEEASKQAFLAGNDVLLINTAERSKQKSLIEAVVNTIDQNTPAQKQQLLSQLDSSFERIVVKKNKIIAREPVFIEQNLVF